MRIPVPSSHSGSGVVDDLMSIPISEPATESPRRRGAAPFAEPSGGVGMRLPPGDPGIKRPVRRLLYSSSAGEPRPESEPADPLLPDPGRSDALESAPITSRLPH
jgi:hypothetical protein